MSKLGYTWYPKDWGNSDAVFELTLIERGLYRELIDMAMLNDNKTVLNYKVWARKFGSTQIELEIILKTLTKLGLIQIDFDGSNELFIPSCEPRLNLSRGGKNGGKKSRKNKPTPKPFLSLEENNGKPTPNQKKVNRKEIEIESNIKETILSSSIWFEGIGMQLKRFDIEKLLIEFINGQELEVGEGNGLNRDIDEIKNHFVRWAKKQPKSEVENIGFKFN